MKNELTNMEIEQIIIALDGRKRTIEGMGRFAGDYEREALEAIEAAERKIRLVRRNGRIVCEPSETAGDD